MAEDIKVEETVEDVKVDETAKEDAPVKEDAKTDEVKDDALEDKQKPENEGEKQLQDALNNIKELETELSQANEKLVKYDVMVNDLAEAKEKIEKATATITEYETLLTNLVDEKIKKIPEDLQDLVPTNMTLTQKLDWVTKAESKNLFKEKKNIDGVEIGKSIGATSPKMDTENLSASSLFTLAYNTLKK